MNHLDLTSMFLLGLSGSGHCLGMCGPLILAFPAATGRFSTHLFYHLGRVITYTGVGAAMGGVGAVLALVLEKGGVDPLFWMVRVEVVLSAIAAVFIALFGLSRLGLIREPAWMSLAAPQGIPGYGSAVDSAIRKKSHKNMLFVGVMLGFLPCGLSYASFARAMASGGPIEGALLSVAFAAGTLPSLLLLGTGASRLAVRYRKVSEIVSGMIMIGMAVSLLAKAAGMALR